MFLYNGFIQDFYYLLIKQKYSDFHVNIFYTEL